MSANIWRYRKPGPDQRRLRTWKALSRAKRNPGRHVRLTAEFGLIVRPRREGS